jgi:hypothetical protein
MCSLLFPKLFPTGKADPTKTSKFKFNFQFKGRRKEFTETVGFKHLLKTVSKRASNGEFYYPYAEHPRFKFWSYDRLRRHRSLDQARIFMKQNPDEANLTIEDLKNKLKSNEGKTVLRNISSVKSSQF